VKQKFFNEVISFNYTFDKVMPIRNFWSSLWFLEQWFSTKWSFPQECYHLKGRGSELRLSKHRVKKDQNIESAIRTSKIEKIRTMTKSI